MSPKIERALTVEATRLGTTPDLLAEQILTTSLAAASDGDLSLPSSGQTLSNLVAMAQTLELRATPSTDSDMPFGEAIVNKYRRQSFTL
ncbi:hypothetical protein CCAX7_62970 [Capsulimonas corticalis]|uniref:Uncharacterized protein n=1 Tax=Capsulimonas corticalis TaxID=2219043 RepID=A0A402CWU4_9BACT|nr:hypothetical protein [Capsulimonas corticalis]BDI34246.1 hypothetical protein CCAX7_62970 [Capsulimonas corticalis]